MGIGLPVENNHLVVENGAIQTNLGPPIIDDFEDQDLSEYSGATSNYTFSTPAKNGSYALEKSVDGGEDLYSTSGLDNYFSKGSTSKIWVYLTERVKIYFGLVDLSNYYEVYTRADSDAIYFYRYIDGSRTTLVYDNTISYAVDNWYEVEIDWGSNDTIAITLYDESGSQITQISATDSTYANETGIGLCTYYAGNKFDYWRIVS